ncbi:MAG TPA: hypothetical protein VFE03_04205, partial [Caulobacteraceae bacterium]|nr:hypothetical protein [Caulobacteraceae bacterium]
ITVASDPPLASSDEARARDAAGEAVGLDAAIGDVVTVTAKPAPGPAPAPASDFSKTRAPPSRLPLWALVAAPVVLLALFAIAALVQRRARRPLSVLQRRRYVRRIESLLAEGTGDAAANT